MILELRLSNIFSFRDEMSLNLQAANIQTRKAQTLKGNVFSIGGEQLLKSVAITPEIKKNGPYTPWPNSTLAAFFSDIR